jgi:hypothetical protein
MQMPIRGHGRSVLLPDPRIRLLGLVRMSMTVGGPRLAADFVAQIGEVATAGAIQLVLLYYALGQFAFFEIGV